MLPACFSHASVCILVLLSKFEDDLFCNFQVHLQSNERMRFSECWEYDKQPPSNSHSSCWNSPHCNLISFVISLRHSQSCRDLWRQICTRICNSLSLHTAQIWHDPPSCETMEDSMVQPIDYPSCILFVPAYPNSLELVHQKNWKNSNGQFWKNYKQNSILTTLPLLSSSSPSKPRLKPKQNLSSVEDLYGWLFVNSHTTSTALITEGNAFWATSTVIRHHAST